jgi:hypothetical protein
MLRRLMLCALALCALAVLAGCVADRIAGPQVTEARRTAGQDFGDHPRTDDPRGEPGLDPTGGELGGAADSLRTAEDAGR